MRREAQTFKSMQNDADAYLEHVEALEAHVEELKAFICKVTGGYFQGRKLRVERKRARLLV